MDHLLQKSSAVYKNPWPLLGIITVITVLLGFGLPKLQVDNDVKSTLPKNEPTRMTTELYDKEANFGPSNAVMVGIQAQDLYSLETLGYIKKLDDELNALNKTLPVKLFGQLLGLSPEESTKVVDDLRSVGINESNYVQSLGVLIRDPQATVKNFGWDQALAAKVAKAASSVSDERLWGVFQPPLGKITSLVTSDYIAFEDDALVTKKMVKGGEPTPESIVGLKDRVHSWDTYEGTLVSKDDTTTTVTAILRSEDKDAKAAVNQELLRLTAQPPAGIKMFVAGQPVIEDHLGNAAAKDMSLLIPVMLLVLLLILFLCFRSLQGVFFPLLLTVVAVVWTFGLMGHLGIPLTTVGSMIPILLMAIVSAYGIHQMNHYYEDPQPRKYDVLHHNSRSVGLAILLSGLTVMIGFGSMVTLDFIPIKNFGLMTAFGDLVGVLAALYLLPAFLMIGKAEKKVRPVVHEEDRKGLIASLLRGVRTFGRKNPGRVILVTAILTLGIGTGIFFMKSDMDLVKMFNPQDSIRVADQIMNEKMAGTKSLTVVLDSDLRDPLTRQGNPEQLVELTSPEVLKKLDQFSTDLRTQFPAVRKVNSYADVLKKMNQVMTGGAAADYKIPDDGALLKQYIVIFSGDSQTLKTNNNDKLRILVTMNSGSIQDSRRVAEYTEKYFDQEFRTKNHLQVKVVGEQQISYTANQTLLKGFVEGIFACLIIVFLLLLVVLRSLRMSLIAVVPIVLCLAVNFGWLGFMGIELNTQTSLVSSIGIGIGVDFSIHFITWYRRELLLDHNVLAAVDRTILHKGRAIVYNWLVIVGGFLVMLGSQLNGLRDFGFLTALCLTVTMVGALVVVPAILRFLAKKDHAFLYLGVKKADPQAFQDE